MMSNSVTRRRYSFFMPVVFSVLAVGCQGGKPPAEEETPEAPVRAEPARKMPLGGWTDLLGTTQPLPKRSARISAAVEGHVLSVLGDGKGTSVIEGQQVEAGQAIVQLDDRVPRANRAKLQATLNDLEEQYKQAEYSLELATIDVNRLHDLLKRGPTGASLPLVSRVELDKALVLQKDARSKLQSVKSRQAAARADLKALDEQLEFYTLRAPIAGRLSAVQAVAGQTLTPGTVVADVVDLNEIDVLCYAPPDTAGRLVLGQAAKLVVEAAAGQRLVGQVAFIGVQADPQTGNVPVKVRFPNPRLALRAHAVVHVYVLTQPEEERLTIPETALVEDLGTPTVVVVENVAVEKKDGAEQKVGKVRKLQAVLGVRDRDQHLVEVLALEDPATKKRISPLGIQFVTAGGYGLRDDDRVKIEAETEKETK